MKKLCKEEKQDLKIETNRFYFFAIIFFLSTEIFPQVPINGFCKYGGVNIPSGYNSLLALNYNNDSYTDLILFNPDKKNIVSLTGGSNGIFGKPVTSRVPLEITNIQNINDINSPIKRYAFTSRQNRKVGIYSFTSSGRALLTGQIKFDSYPENISAVDINGNGKDELLISGPAFNGLSILYLTSKGIINKKILQGRSFSDAVFADLSHDDLNDIAAFDAMNNSLVFFYNMGNNKFKEVRSFRINEKIHLLHTVDLNLDHLQDLIFTKGKSIVVMLGDNTSSYDNIETINTLYTPDEIITGDFNQDGKIDIAYINKKNSTLSILYANNENGFYPEIVYLRRDGLESLIPYYSKFINGIEAVSDQGKIFSISNLTSLSETVDVIFSPKPRDITCFDRGNNGIIDFCYIDSAFQTLNLIVRNNSGIPAWYYSYSLSEYHSQVLVDNDEPETKTFYCFDRGKRLIEVYTINFKDDSINKNFIYSPEPIKDLKVNRNSQDAPVIYIAYVNQGILGLSIIEYHNYRYSYTNYQNLAHNVEAVNISLRNGISLNYWQNFSGSVTLKKVQLNDENFYTSTKASYSVPNLSSITLLTAEFLNKDEDETLSFINSEDNSFTVFSSDKSTFVSKNKSLSGIFSPFNDTKLYFGSIRNGGLKLLFASFGNEIDRIDFIHGGKEIIPQKVTLAENPQSYFIKNLSFRKTHLVYINQEEECIKIKRLL